MFPKVSVVTLAFRPGGIDITLAGMRDQTFRDFEVVLVDRRYEHRHDQVMELARKYGVSLIHVPEHRRNGKWVSFASAWQTGFALARGDVVILMVDWMYAPPGWIERHLDVLGSKRRYVIGSYIFIALPDLDMKVPYDFDLARKVWEENLEVTETSPVSDGKVLDEMYVFKDGPFDPAWIPELVKKPTHLVDLRRTELRRPAGPWVGEGWLHLKNESLHRSVLYEINGVDERLERGRGPLDIDIQYRLIGAGVELWWQPDIDLYYFDPHYIDPAVPFGATKPVRLEGRWSWEDGKEYVRRRRLEMQLGGSVRAKNPYDLAEFSNRMEKWRDGVLDPDPVDVDDMTYWGREIWPESH